MASSGKIRIEFLCRENAGRSQMAAAFAERERDERALHDVVEISSSGTRPADSVHEEVVEAMDEVGVDISDRTPTWVVVETLNDSHFVITMGCTVSQFNPEHYGVESREWDLTDPAGQEMETVREVRDEIERRVEALFDEIEETANERAAKKSLSQRVTDTVRNVIGSGPS